MSAWQPIESAPKDGTPILVWPTPDYGNEFVRIGIDMWCNDTWWLSRHNMRPTHWMPLPEPPQ